MKYLIGSGHEINENSTEKLFLYFNENNFKEITMEMIRFSYYERLGIEKNILLKLLHKTDFQNIIKNSPIYDEYINNIINNFLDKIIKKK